MNRTTTLTTIGLALVLCVSVVRAAEKPTEEYVKGMKAFNAANGALRAAVPAKDYDAIAAAAASLKPHAELLAKFWAGRASEVAPKLSADVLKAVGDLETAAKAKDDAGMTAAAGVISGSCRMCHTAHRSERLPDGTYEIK